MFNKYGGPDNQELITRNTPPSRPRENSGSRSTRPGSTRLIGRSVPGLPEPRVSAPVLVAGLAFGAAALLFTAVAELLVEAYEIKESTGTIAMAAVGFLVFLLLMMLM